MAKVKFTIEIEVKDQNNAQKIADVFTNIAANVPEDKIVKIHSKVIKNPKYLTNLLKFL